MSDKTTSICNLVAVLRQIADKKTAKQNSCSVLSNIIQQKEKEEPLHSGTKRKGGVTVRQKSIVKSQKVYVNVNGNTPQYTEVKLTEDYSLIKELDSHLSDIEGQAYAVQAVKEYLFGINNRENVHAVGGLLTFMGPSAAGKTMMGERIAEALHRPILHLDMSTFNDREIGLCDLFGVNRSFKAAEKGSLTSFVEENPVSVVILDEFEKAHANVQNRFLQVFDRGETKDLFTERTVSFRNVIIIVIMNIGKQLYDRSLTTYNLSNVSQSVIIRALRTEVNPQTQTPYFSNALISRLSTGKIILFNKLRPEILHRITVKEIAKEEKYYRDKYGLELQVNRKMLAELIILGIGEQADIRVVIKAVKEFFSKNLVRLVELNRAQKRPFIAVRCEFDSATESPEAEEVFHSHNKTRVLVCCKKVHRKIFRQYESDEAEILFSDGTSFEDAVKGGDISLAILDSEEEEKNFSRRLFGSLTEREAIPVYVYHLNATSDVPLLFYLDHGATDVFRGRKRFLAEWVGEILSGSKFTDVAQTLFRANKVVRFQTAYSFEPPQTAILSITHIDVTLAQDAGDIEKFATKREIPNIQFDDIYGAKDAKEEMIRILTVLKDPKKYIRKGLRLPRGILLEGDPGTGKTMLAKAFAHEAHLPFIQKNASEFRQKWQGEGARAVRDLFVTARKYAPAVIFIDEIDAIAKAREDSVNEGSTEALNALLSEMDGFADNSDVPVFLIAATNFNFKKGKTLLDPAFLRRFDRKIHIDLPDSEARKRYLSDRISQYQNEVSSRMIENLARRSIGWSLGELDNVLQNALREAYSGEGKTIADVLLNEAFERYADGESKQRGERELQHTAIHEAGHAVVASLLGLMPSYATIGARGGYGGYVYYGDEGITVLSREECLDRIAIMMAGREAERSFYGEAGITSGASSDLKAATELAVSMFCEYGMDDDLPVFIDQIQRSSPQVMRRVKTIIQSQSVRARSLIESNLEQIRSVSNALLEKVNIDQTDLRNLCEKEKEKHGNRL